MPFKNQNLFVRYGMPVLLFFFVGMLVRDIWGFKTDNDAFLAWATHNIQSGLGNAYNNPYGTDYLPLYHYILYGYAWLLGDVATLKEWFPCIHLVTLLFDMLGIWFIYRWTDKRYEYNTLLLLLVFNIGYSYNTLIWGQIDGILSALLLASLYFAWQGRMVAGAVFFVLAINIKLQAIVLLPVFGLLYLGYVGTRRNFRVALLPLLSAVVTQVLVLLPFMAKENGLVSVWHVVTGSVGKWPFISMNAFNFWYLVHPDPLFVPDNTVYALGLTYKQFGLLLFMLTSFLALLPLVASVWKRITGKAAGAIDRRQLWLVAAIVNLLFFYCNTQMHERYCHPALVFVAVYAIYSRDFFPFILFSVTYFLSLERVMQYLQLNVHNKDLLIFNAVMLSLFYLFIIGYLAFRLWQVSAGRQHNIKTSDKPMPGLSEGTA